MGTTNIPQLPLAVFLDGTELVWIVQGGATDKRTTTGAIADLAAGITPAGALTQRAITSAGNLPILSTDNVLNVNVAGGLSISIPLGASRKGLPLIFHVLQTSGTITLIALGSDTFYGSTSHSVSAGTSITLAPYNDGVNSGYAIQ